LLSATRRAIELEHGVDVTITAGAAPGSLTSAAFTANCLVAAQNYAAGTLSTVDAQGQKWCVNWQGWPASSTIACDGPYPVNAGDGVDWFFWAQPGNDFFFLAGTQRLKKAYRRALVIGIDRSGAMLGRARQRRSFLAPFELARADAAALPVADASVDLAVSSFALHWAGDPGPALAEVARVLRPAGTLHFATLGPGTLGELREAYRALGRDMPAPPDPEALGSALLRLGFADPVLDTERYTLTYADIGALLRELRAVGGLALRRPGGGLRGRHHLRELAAAYPPGPDAARLAVTVEVIFARAARGTGPRRRTAGDVAVPVTAIGRRGR
jgi:malonyl-CoA O-methyltransferase